MVFQDRVIQIYSENEAAVARVKAAFQRGEGEERKVSLMVGTGFFISADGQFLTNASTVAEAQRIFVEHHGHSYRATVKGLDIETNIALLRLERVPENFRFLPIDEAPDAPVGSIAIAISSPLEFDPSPSLGLISGHETNFGNRVFPTVYLRSTIPAHPGDGGSPVFDLNGRFIGMMVASLPEMGSSYLIPARAVERVRKDLQAEGRVRRGWMGFGIEESLDAGGRSFIKITDIVPGSPAETAGLRPGDELLAFAGTELTDVRELRRLFFFSRVDQFISLRVRRESRDLVLSLRIAERPNDLNGATADENP